MEAPSTLSLLAAALYLLVFTVCAMAATKAITLRQPASHARAWIAISLFFAVLVALRLFSVEDFMRIELRNILRAGESYAERNEVQLPIVIAILVAGAALLFIGVRRGLARAAGRRDRAVLAAKAAVAAMVGLIALRVISLHATDALLYGPLKLNWVADIGLAVLVGLASAYYVRLFRSQ